jgi:putative acetyltransferase
MDPSGGDTNQDGFQIRPATNADTAGIKDVVFSALVEYGLKPDPGGSDADLDDVEAKYFRRGGYFEVVEAAGGRIVGTVGLYPWTATKAELRKMYLAPAMRRRGLGQRLVRRILVKARELGFREVFLQTNTVLKEAIALYGKYGFQPCHEELRSPRCDQAYMLKLDAGRRDSSAEETRKQGQ